jgi:hypothetical protein
MTSSETGHGTRSVRGIVIPAEWGPSGTVTRVAILGSEEEEYHVIPLGQGEALVHFLREEVIARIRVDRDEKGAKLATVLSFEVLDDGPRPSQGQKSSPG